MNPISDKYRLRLTNLLKELFQLDQPELDFGLYKIMHLKSEQITRFLENDLLKEIEQAFGEKESIDANALKESAINKLIDSLGEDALDQLGNLQEPFAKLPAGKKYLEEIAAAETAKDSLNAESEIYDHLYRFFERYYDNGDFMSRRYYARESDTRAAPYSIPYDGREVYLHWANKDQYYIKSSEYLSNYTFELNEAIRQEVERQKTQKGKGLSFDFGEINSESFLKVHFRLIDASEGEHGNIKTASDQKRFFILHTATPIKLEQGELVIHFEYRSDKEKVGQDHKWQESRLQQAEVIILDMLHNMPDANAFVSGLCFLVPTDSKEKRTLLGKYMQKYASKNSMDYFIHKDLGGFLRRELDFYIKNEIIHLDDLESANVPKVEQYLIKVKVLRRIAHQLIAFLAQMEEFQKKLWLKKKFVTDVHWLITLDKIPASFYPQIILNDEQWNEWEKLGFLNCDVEMVDLVSPKISRNLEYLQSNSSLILDTSLFDLKFTSQVLSLINNLEDITDGVLVHSENFQALSFMEKRYYSQIKCIYTDPPYNTGSDGFPYKDSYQSSSWMTMMYDRLGTSKVLLKQDGLLAHYIDENEHTNASMMLNFVFGFENRCGDIVWKNSSKNDQSYVSMQHEYLLITVNDKNRNKGEWTERKDGLEEIYSAFQGFKSQFGKNWKSIHEAALKWYRQYPESNPITDSKHYSWMDERGVYFPSDISGPNFGQYRYDVLHPVTKKICREPNSGWRYPEETMNQRISDNLVHFGDDESTIPNNKTYLKNTEFQSLTSIKYRDGRVASKLLGSLFGSKAFTNPKDLDLSTRFLRAFQTKDGIVLDFFAGTGTTGHATIALNKEDQGRRKYLLVEMGEHFHTVLKPRIQKAIYSTTWKGGRAISNDGISQIVKVISLESYEDTLNNLVLQDDAKREAAISSNSELQRDYLLNYFLDAETQESQSLLNIKGFRDPTLYQMKIKDTGSEVQKIQNIDLIETFNWLIGLRVENLGAPISFNAYFERENDPDLPADHNTRLICKQLTQNPIGAYWFRLIEGYTLKIAGDDNSKIKTLIVWRKQTEDAEKDNAVLQKYLMEKLQISPRENTYDVIYVNGSHTLPNPIVEGEHTKVRLIEEAFHSAMWSGEAA